MVGFILALVVVTEQGMFQERRRQGIIHSIRSVDGFHKPKAEAQCLLVVF